MEKKFSIGEIAKIHNVSVQTLRHYDNIGLLKPIYINKSTGYRYYSANQFVTIDLIKQCKSMGLPLEEVKEIIENYTSCESILDIISRQKKIIDKKIEELNNLRNNIIFLEDSINEILQDGFDKVFIKEYDERVFIKYDYSNRYTEEFEINLSKALVDAEKKYHCFNKQLAFSTSYNSLKQTGRIKYDSVLIRFTDGVFFDASEKVTLPKGKYLTINFDDDYKEPQKYYNILMDYIKKNNINVKQEFYEIYVITRVGNDGVEKSLGKIQILLKD